MTDCKTVFAIVLLLGLFLIMNTQSAQSELFASGGTMKTKPYCGGRTPGVCWIPSSKTCGQSTTDCNASSFCQADNWKPTGNTRKQYSKLVGTFTEQECTHDRAVPVLPKDE